MKKRFHPKKTRFMVVILCGYMGSGKSLIGKKLAVELDFSFVDLDDEIERQERLTIPEIFEQKGEIKFRKLESEVMQSCLLREENMVLSLGGGTPCYGNNMEVLKHHKKTVLFYLKVNLETLTERLYKEKHSRPLIQEIKTREKLNDFIRKHLFERQYFYYQCDVTIDTSELPPEEVVEEIRDLAMDRWEVLKK